MKKLIIPLMFICAVLTYAASDRVLQYNKTTGVIDPPATNLNFGAGGIISSGTVDNTEGLTLVAEPTVSNSPATVSWVNDLVSSFATKVLYGTTNLHSTLYSAYELSEYNPASTIIFTNSLSDGTNWVGYWFWTNAEEVIRSGVYDGHFHANKRLDSKLLQRLYNFCRLT